MKRIWIALALSAAIGCNVHQPEQSKGDLTVRVKVLENGTMTYVTLNNKEARMLRPLDTVWVDLAKHVVDDTCNTALKAVIYLTLN